MEAKDLMIGDWVYRPDCHDQVKEIRQNGIIGLDSLRGLIGFSEIKPIPLTPEILEKNGLTRESDGKIVGQFFKEDSKRNLEISADSKGIWWTINRWEYDILCFKYVHELQHALRLCKIEKEIIL